MIPAFLLRHWRVLLAVLAVLTLYAAFRWYVAGEIEQARKDDAAAVAKVDAIAEVSNATAPVYLDALRRAAADRVREPARCPTSSADMPGTDRPAESNDQDSSASGMVSVAADDWDKLVAASGQAAMCVRAGQALIASGVAVEGND